MLGTQRVNKSISWSHNYLLEVIPVISVDTGAVSLWKNTNARVVKTLLNCDKKNHLTDTYCVDHLLSKVSSEHVTVRSSLSPIEGVGLPYFKNHLNPNLQSQPSIPTFLKAMISFVFQRAMAWIFKVMLLTAKKRELFLFTLCVQIPLKILHLKRLQPYYLAKLTSYMNLILRKESNLIQTVVEFS